MLCYVYNIKSMKFNLLIILAPLFFISCGLPDVTGITQDMNQPFIVRTIPGDTKVTVVFEAQNNEPAFSGYNIYFGDSVNPRKYKLYNAQQNLPTMQEQRRETLKTYTYIIEPNLYYSTNSTDIGQLNQGGVDIANGTPMYIWVGAYQISPTLESYYYYDNFVQMGTPRPEALNQNITVGSPIGGVGTPLTRSLARVVNNGGILYFENVTGGSIQRQTATSLTDITIPPELGYVTSNLEIIADRLYLLKITEGGNSYYGKIFVKSVSGTSAVVDYCYQPSANILSY